MDSFWVNAVRSKMPPAAYTVYVARRPDADEFIAARTSSAVVAARNCSFESRSARDWKMPARRPKPAPVPIKSALFGCVSVNRKTPTTVAEANIIKRLVRSVRILCMVFVLASRRSFIRCKCRSELQSSSSAAHTGVTRQSLSIDLPAGWQLFSPVCAAVAGPEPAESG